ncbi:hypothetical protein QEH56_16835 [Pelagicoccus enzymogenes]|uniref:hypothetical protein n=1 Tax=Pelagicoccus enzymogenes TaxID=2773457 RepID=UPI00280CE28A|nr:hypothetical protein [Pelagicoccus enzymogenes]MDQ8199831.1 hypothetical protein [Pelagicoccus enzymogenes]
MPPQQSSNGTRLLNALKQFFLRLHQSLPAISPFPESDSQPGLKLFIHGNIVTIRTNHPTDKEQ